MDASTATLRQSSNKGTQGIIASASPGSDGRSVLNFHLTSEYMYGRTETAVIEMRNLDIWEKRWKSGFSGADNNDGAPQGDVLDSVTREGKQRMGMERSIIICNKDVAWRQAERENWGDATRNGGNVIGEVRREEVWRVESIWGFLWV